MLRRWGNLWITDRFYLSPQISAPQRPLISVDGNFLGVSGRVAISGVLCFTQEPRRLTAG